MTRRLLSRFPFVVVLLADTIFLLLWLRPCRAVHDCPRHSLPIEILQALFFNSHLFWGVTVPLVVARTARVVAKKFLSHRPAPMRKIVLIADLLAVMVVALSFGAYRWWMFYGFLACIIVIEISVRYLKEIYWTQRVDL